MRSLKVFVSSLALVATLLGGSPARAQSISYGLAVLDNGAQSAFNITFFTAPFAPVFGMVSYTVSIEGTLTDGSGGLISAQPVGPDTSIFSFFSGGVEVFSDPLGAISSSFGPLSYTGMFDCGLAGCSDLQANVHFLGSGGGDTYAFAGSLQFDADPPNHVPEPGTLALLAIGLAGLSFCRLKR